MPIPTEWTYGGQLDWTSPESIRFNIIKPYIDCIVQAIRERWLACFLRTKARTWDIYAEEWGTIKDYSILNSTYQAAIDIRNDIEDLIEWSLDYTQSPYMDGLSVPIFWTENSIKQYLEFDSLIKIDKLYPLSAEWAYQCYKILNALKIFSPVYYMTYFPSASSTEYTIKEGVQCGPYKSRYRGASMGGDVSWSDLMAKYAITPEDEETTYSGEYLKRSAAYIFYEGNRGFAAERYRTRYSAYIFGIGSATVRLTTTYKLYLSFLRGSSSGFTFDNHGDVNVENSIIKYQMEETLSENTDFIFTNYIPISDSFTQPTVPQIGEPEDQRAYGLTGYSNSGERRTFVITCEPIFSFKDA